ncbi:rhamnan synthesis F family protein [Asticcacaulis excentricus]|uniref:rhamnan synthesis F family protein n=1 Tax=Asticcacaulis excentricus TaxID=78587 RepID=UPI001562C369|nr:rhamnan synthesis F family protein [Asticcacaulis excentricus]
MKRALVMAHYDKHSIVDAHVLHTLRTYRQYFSKIIFVSVSNLASAELAKLEFLTDEVINRNNIGYDFYSWKLGISRLNVREYDEIVISNDSSYGPLTDIGSFFYKSLSIDADIWGASINKQFAPHVQSYFLSFRRGYIASGAFSEFWNSVVPISDKMEMILKYEVGLSSGAVQRGFKIGAIVEFGEISEDTIRQVAVDNDIIDVYTKRSIYSNHPLFDPIPNPVQLYWSQAFRMGLPFLKVEVMRDNPIGNKHDFIFDRIKREKLYDVELIRRHQSRINSDFI